MTSLTGGNGPGGAGDVSRSFHLKQGTVFSYLRLTYRLTLWQIHRCFRDLGNPWVVLLVERLSHSTSLQGEVKSSLKKTTKCVSVRIFLFIMLGFLLCFLLTILKFCTTLIVELPILSSKEPRTTNSNLKINQ